MIFLKGGSILVGLMLVPITIDYVDPEQYGIWMTITSMITWMSFFDIGVNNGLKNKLAEALAKNDFLLGKRYVSTAYAILSAICVPLMVLLVVLCPLIDWDGLLKISDSNSDLSLIMQILCCYFCVNTIISTINIVLIADQRPANAAFRTLVQQALSLIIIFILTKVTIGSLFRLCIVYTAVPLAVGTIFNFTLFRKKYKNISPAISSIDWKLAPPLMKLGVKFFIIQIAGIIQFQLVSFLIIRNFGPQEVTDYNVAYRLFSVVTMAWGILTAPLWAAATNAIAQEDFEWIRRACKKYMHVLILVAIGGGILLCISPWIYKVWVGDKVTIPFALSFWILVYNIILCYSTVYVQILNGASIVRAQTICSLISPFVFLALCYWFIDLGCGIEGILIASILSNFNGFIVSPIQVANLTKRFKSDTYRRVE